MTRPAKQVAPSTLYVGSELDDYNGLVIFFTLHMTPDHMVYNAVKHMHTSWGSLSRGYTYGCSGLLVD